MHIEFNQDDIERLLTLTVQHRGFQVRNVLIEPVYDQENEYMGVTAQVEVCDNSFDPGKKFKAALGVELNETSEPKEQEKE